MNQTKTGRIKQWKDGEAAYGHEELIGEEPLALFVERRPYSVLMRTPGEEIFHTAGLCLTEGLVVRPEDLVSVDYSEERDPNRVDVTLSPERKERFFSLFPDKTPSERVKASLSGQDLIEDLLETMAPVKDDFTIDAAHAIESIGSLRQHQKLHARTSSTHAMLLLDIHLRVLAAAEDVGRHNALDKVIGRLFMEHRLQEAKIAVLSSRISYELVKKAGYAGLTILLSVSRPTALAVELGRRLNMTLACTGKKPLLMVFCGEERIGGGKG